LLVASNSVRCDPHGIADKSFGSASSFGNYRALLIRPGVLQLPPRYAF